MQSRTRQLALVIPELDLIAVFTAWNIYDSHSLPVGEALERVRAMVGNSPR